MACGTKALNVCNDHHAQVSKAANKGKIDYTQDRSAARGTAAGISVDTHLVQALVSIILRGCCRLLLLCALPGAVLPERAFLLPPTPHRGVLTTSCCSRVLLLSDVVVGRE
jgi:hypothetical protein